MTATLHATALPARAADLPEIRRIETADLTWALAEGWKDFTEKRGDLIFLGLLYPVICFVAVALAFNAPLLPLLFPLVAGLSIAGPAVASGFYELARRREEGRDSSWWHFLDPLNGRSRWPDEYDTLEQMGADNLAGLEKDVADLGIDCQLERTGVLSVAYEPHQVRWLEEQEHGTWLDEKSVQAEIDSPIFRAGRWSTDDCALVHPGRLVKELARVASDLGVEIHTHSAVTDIDSRRAGPVSVRTTRGVVRSDKVALATNVFRPLLRRARLLTVPVYDYVLMTEPLSADQMADIGWTNRQGLSDMANQFHYSRLTADHRILYGGYDAIYHSGRQVRPEYEDREASYRRLASHFFTTFPQLEGHGFSHRWAGAIDTSTQFCAFHGLARRGRVAYAGGFTGLGVAATRFAAEVMLDRLDGRPTPRTQLEMVRKSPLPFPPEPFAKIGIEATKWSLDRADHREGHRNVMLRTLDRLGLGFDS